MWMWLLCLSWISLNGLTVGLAAQETPSKGTSDPAVGTTVISKKMTFKNQESMAVFDGAVVLTRGTFVVYSDRMVVSFHQARGMIQRKRAEPGKTVTPAKGPDTCFESGGQPDRGHWASKD